MSKHQTKMNNKHTSKLHKQAMTKEKYNYLFIFSTL